MDDRVAKLIYRSRHRGCKENDILLYDFSYKIHALSDEDLEIYADLLDENDADLYNWLSGVSPCPKRYEDLIYNIVKRN